MKKIPTIFRRDFPDNPKLVTRERNPACAWVFRGEGVPTVKLDGTCCLMRDGVLYKRREVKPGGFVPKDFIEVDFDEKTGKRVGWLHITDEDKWHRDALLSTCPYMPADGTYELVGPKIQGNPEGFDRHRLVAHGQDEAGPITDLEERTFYGIRDWLAEHNVEGIVFHHPDGRMAKIKGRDFGLARKR